MNDALIFINYGRKDASGDAGRLTDSLRELFEDQYFFLDVNQVQVGDNFPPLIKKSIDQCEIFIAVIGPRWLQMIRRSETEGEVNWVKTEIALALKKKKFILPVLVSGARMPLENQLPDEIKALAAINAAELSHTRWTHDIGRIGNTINRKNIPYKKETKRWDNKSFLVSVAIIAVILTMAIFISQKWNVAGKPQTPAKLAARNAPYFISGIWKPLSDKQSAVHYNIVYAANRVVIEQFTNGVLSNTGYGTLKEKELNVLFSERPARTFKLNLSDDQQTLIGSLFLRQINDTISAGIPVTWQKMADKVR